MKVEVWRRDRGQCVQCGSTKNLHYDHDIPFSKGHLGKSDREASGVLSSAQRHTHFLDSPAMELVLGASDVDLRALKSERVSLYLILPPHRVEAYRRWLRLMIGCALNTMWRTPGQPDERVLFDPNLHLQHPPGYRLVLHLWLRLGQSELWLRLLPALAGVWAAGLAFFAFFSSALLGGGGVAATTTSLLLPVSAFRARRKP